MAKKKDIDLLEVERLSSLGLNKVQICAALGISVRTYGRLENEDSEFNVAISKGNAKLAAEVSELMIAACNKGSVEAMKFTLERKCGWTKSMIVSR